MITSQNDQSSNKKWSRRTLKDNSKTLFESRLALGELFCALSSQQSIEISKLVNMSRSSLYRLKKTAKQVLEQGKAYRIPKLGKPGFLTDRTRQEILNDLKKEGLLKDNLPLKQQICVASFLPYIQKHFPPSKQWHQTHPQLYREWNRCHNLNARMHESDSLPSYPLVVIVRDQDQHSHTNSENSENSVATLFMNEEQQN